MTEEQGRINEAMKKVFEVECQDDFVSHGECILKLEKENEELRERIAFLENELFDVW
jgi:hypothetical protein